MIIKLSDPKFYFVKSIIVHAAALKKGGFINFVSKFNGYQIKKSNSAKLLATNCLGDCSHFHVIISRT